MRSSGRSAVAVIVGAGAAGSIGASVLAVFLLDGPHPKGVPQGQGFGDIIPILTMFSLPGTLIGALVLELACSAWPRHLSVKRKAFALLVLGPVIGAVLPALPFLVGRHLTGAVGFAIVGAFYALCTTVAWLLLDYRLAPANDG